MPHRYIVGGYSIVRSSESGIALHYDTVLRRLASRSKETKEKMDTFCKTETCWMGPIEELGYMLEAF